MVNTLRPDVEVFLLRLCCLHTQWTSYFQNELFLWDEYQDLLRPRINGLLPPGTAEKMQYATGMQCLNLFDWNLMMSFLTVHVQLLVSFFRFLLIR